MKTIREWYNELPEEVREKALANTAEDELDTMEPDLYNALAGMFWWEETPEGFLYWAEVAMRDGIKPLSFHYH
jgi:hypothetical protein